MVRRHFVPRHFVPGHILSRDNMSPGQYVALCPHYFAVQMGDILSQETYCPGSVRRHFVPGDVLSRLATNGNFWTDIDILRTDIDICLFLVFWFFFGNFLCFLMVLLLFCGWQKFERLICGSADVVSGRHIVRMTFGQDGLPPLDICQDYACRDKLSPDPRPYIPVFFCIIFLQIYLL